MANMFKAVKAKDVKGYLASVPADRKAAIHFLQGFIRKSAPKLKGHFAYNMLGYGSFPYLNLAKKLISWPVVALANQKQYISIYICSIVDGQYVAEVHRKSLGKESVGRSCIRFRRVADVNLPVLRKMLRLAARHPGLVRPGSTAGGNS